MIEIGNALPALPSPSGGSAVSLPGAPRKLSRRAKAAIVVRLLLNDGADIALEDLPDELQAELTTQMGAMRLVDRDTVKAVVEEFADELEAVGLSFSGGIAGALDSLDGKISPHTAARLRREAGVRQSGDPWARIVDLPVEKIVPVFESESVEICAVVLSKLNVAKAAELLGKLSGPLARQITYAMNQTTGVTPEAIDRIGLSLASQLDAAPVSVFDSGPIERVGAILNSTTAAVRDDMLTGLDETDRAFADEVRKAIFTFANIKTRVAPRDLAKVLKEVDQDTLVTAFVAAEPAGLSEITDYILENMSKRMSEQIREEMQEKGKVKPADGEAAMSEIVAAVRRLEAAAEIILITEDADEDE